MMADETTDVSNQGQVVICIRWVDDDQRCHEDFIGIKPIARCTADQIVELLKNVLADMTLKLENCRGQCYGWASVMSGHKTGVAAQIKVANAKVLHTYGHALNLCVKDAQPQSQMQKFYLYFGCRLGEMILSQTDNFSKTLQKKNYQPLKANI